MSTKKTMPLYIVVFSILLTIGCQSEKKTLSRQTLSSIAFKQARQIYDNMTLKQKIGQLFMVTLPDNYLSAQNKKKLKSVYPGSIILFKKNLSSFDQTRQWLFSMQIQTLRQGLPPLFITTDQEYGKVIRITKSMTLFPDNFTMGRSSQTIWTQKAATITGIELGAYSLNMNLAPVADINNNPRNPVIGTRSYHHTSQRVAAHVATYIQGFQAAQMFSVAKHFPGHGDTHIDSHKALPVIQKSLDQLRAMELIPFHFFAENKSSTDSQDTLTQNQNPKPKASTAGIMTAHILFPKIDSQPATLSGKILTDLLRHKMKFHGLIITDDLVMNAIQNHYSRHNMPPEVQSVLAGANIIIHTGSLKQIQAVQKKLIFAIQQNIITPETLRSRVIQTIAAKLYLYYQNTDLSLLKNIYRSRKCVRKKILQNSIHSIYQSEQWQNQKQYIHSKQKHKVQIHSSLPYFRQLIHKMKFPISENTSSQEATTYKITIIHESQYHALQTTSTAKNKNTLQIIVLLGKAYQPLPKVKHGDLVLSVKGLYQKQIIADFLHNIKTKGIQTLFTFDFF